jgi:hypothetical protein
MGFKLNEISKELKLVYTSQDWGIVNSDSSRLSNFIEYFYENENVIICNKEVKYSFFELIISSYNDYLIERDYNINVDKIMSKFFKSYNEDSDFVLLRDYWRQIKSKLEFPVGYKL